MSRRRLDLRYILALVALRVIASAAWLVLLAAVVYLGSLYWKVSS